MSYNDSADSPSVKPGAIRLLAVWTRSEIVHAYLVLCLLCLVLFAMEGWHEWSSRATYVQETQAATKNLAQSLMQEAEGAIATADAALVGVVQRLEEDGTGPEALGRLARLLAINSINQPHLRGFSVDGRSGARLISSVPNLPAGVSNAERDYFQHHRNDPDRGLFLAAPTRSQLNGEWIIIMSRRFQDLDGQFAGIVVTSVASANIARMYAAFDVGRAGLIALLQLDGTIMSRHPFDDAVIGRILPSVTPLLQRAAREPAGRYDSISPIDGVARLGSYRRGDRFPLVLIVAKGTDEALAGWVRRAWFRLTAVLVVACVIVLLGLRLIGQIRRRRRADLGLIRSEAQFRMLAEHASDMVSRVGPDGVRRYASPAAKRLFGIAPAELIGLRPEANIHSEDRPEFMAVVASLDKDHEQGGLSYRARRPDGTEIWIESTLRLVCHPETGAPDGYVGISRDVTISKAMEAKLAALASTDGLTGISNRRRFDEALFLEWRRSARDRTWLAVLLLDVDHFKGFNDLYGHLAGDDCLRTVARVIAETVCRPADLTARYGGEEFAVILPSTDLTGALYIAERIRAAIQAAAVGYKTNGASVVTVSIGVAAIAPGARTMLETSVLVGAADLALYEAKRMGRNRVVSASAIDAAAPVPLTDGFCATLPAAISANLSAVHNAKLV